MKTSIYAVTALAAGSNALTMRQDDPHLADFRLYGADGCQDQNLGVWTVVQSDLAASNCTVFDDAVKSVSVTDIVPGCTLFVYADTECVADKQSVAAAACEDAANTWEAWSMECAQ